MLVPHLKYRIHIPLDSLTGFFYAQHLHSGRKILADASTVLTTPGRAPIKLDFPFINQAGRPIAGPERVLYPETFKTDAIGGGIDLGNFNGFIDSIISFFKKRLQHKVFILYTTRGRIEHTFPSGMDSDWVGPNGEYLIPVLAKIFSRDEHSHIAERISHWANKFGITNIKAGWWGANILGSDFTDAELQANLNTALAGHGSRQVLTIITQIFWSKADDILLIEEPEISLHPDAQVFLPELFAEAIKEGKTIVITTHSTLLTLALSRPIKQGLIGPADIAVYNFKMEQQRGTTVTKLELNEQGYIKGWVPSFAGAERELMKEFLETVSKE